MMRSRLKQRGPGKSSKEVQQTKAAAILKELKKSEDGSGPTQESSSDLRSGDPARSPTKQPKPGKPALWDSSATRGVK